MRDRLLLGVLSDIHFASDGEKARGGDYEFRGISNPLVKLLLRFYRRYIWLRYPLEQNHLLNEFIEKLGPADFVVANGDYSCDSGFVGVSDDAAFESAKQCLARLRKQYGQNFQAIIGDHELGKRTLVGGCGGMRLKSWTRTIQELQLQPFWKINLGPFILMGVTSSLIALPVFEQDTLPEELSRWRELREEHLLTIRNAFLALPASSRIILFCHDPTALPFLLHEEPIRARIKELECTVIGHLHSPLILWKSRRLAGIPKIRFLGPSIDKFSTALQDARTWKKFKVKLCPSLAGIELLKDGGFLSAELSSESAPLRIVRHYLPRI
jgi:hypothetical protein